MANTKYLDFKIYGFMRGLGLSGPALLIYAVVFAFTSGERGYYYGSYKRIADSVGVSERTVYKHVGRMIETGLIEHFHPADGYVGGIRCVQMPKSGHYLKPKGAEDGFADPRDRGGESLLRVRDAFRESAEDADFREYRASEADELVSAKIFDEERADKLVSAKFFDEERADKAADGVLLTKYRVISVGRSGEVLLEEKQYDRLKSILPPEQLYYYIRRLEKHIESGGARPYSCYKTLMRWIEADLGIIA